VEDAKGGRKRKFEMEPTSRKQNVEDCQPEINKEIHPHMKISDKDWDAFKEGIEKEREAARSRDFATWSDWLDKTEVALDDLIGGLLISEKGSDSDPKRPDLWLN